MGTEPFVTKGDRACLGDSCFCWSLGRELEGIFEVLEQIDGDVASAVPWEDRVEFVALAS